MIDDKKLNHILSLMFRQVNVPQKAKEKLKERLFGRQELSSEELSYIAAAGNLDRQNQEDKPDPFKNNI